MLQARDYTFSNPATCLPAHLALSKYRRFRALLNERKNASNYPPVHITYPKAGFFDLPGELRNQIYELAGIAGHIFELHPLPGSDFCNGRPEAAGIAQDALTRYRNKIRPLLPLMRVNKQVNDEVSAIFYGQNIFRFSGNLGWFFLEGFMHSIGEANTARLRNITVHAHWKGKDRELTSSGRHYQDIEFMAKHRRIIPLKKDGTADGGREEAIEECVRMLSEGGSLATLSLILPTRFEVHNPLGLTFDASMFPDGIPKITLIHLQPHGHGNSLNASQKPLKQRIREIILDPTRVLEAQYSTKHHDVRAFAHSQGWDYERKWQDDNYNFEGDADYTVPYPLPARGAIEDRPPAVKQHVTTKDVTDRFVFTKKQPRK